MITPEKQMFPLRCHWIALLFSLLLMLPLVGCGGPNVQPVHGKITFQGKPVGPGEILFAPDKTKGTKGKTALGTINADGVYELTSYKPGDGAIAGHHKVVIRAKSSRLGGGDESLGRQSNSSLIPPAYLSFARTPLSAEVVEGDNQIDFDLK